MFCIEAFEYAQSVGVYERGNNMKKFILLLLAIGMPAFTLCVGSSVFRRFVKNSKLHDDHKQLSNIQKLSNIQEYEDDEEESEQEVAVPFTYSNRIETDAKIATLRQDHLQDLQEQKKRLEQEYARQAEKLLQERSYLTDQLLQERKTRHMVEQQEQNLTQRIALFEQELAHIKEHMNREKEIVKNQYQQECQALRSECQELKKQLQAYEQERATIEHAIKQEYDQKMVKTNQELNSLKKRLQTLNERYQKTMNTLVLKDNDIANKDKHIAELKSQVYTQTERIANLEHHVKELGTSLDYEKTRRMQARSYIQELEKKNQDMLKMQEALQQEVAALKNDIMHASIQEELLRKKYEPFMAEQQLAQSKP